MKTVRSAVSLIALLALPIGCNPFAPDQSVILAVTKLDAPLTALADNPFTVTLTVRTGGCTSFDRIDVQKMPAGVRIVPWGTNASLGKKGVSCPAYIQDGPHSVQVDPPFSNPYYVNVEQGRLPPLTAKVEVQ